MKYLYRDSFSMRTAVLEPPANHEPPPHLMVPDGIGGMLRLIYEGPIEADPVAERARELYEADDNRPRRWHQASRSSKEAYLARAKTVLEQEAREVFTASPGRVFVLPPSIEEQILSALRGIEERLEQIADALGAERSSMPAGD